MKGSYSTSGTKELSLERVRLRDYTQLLKFRLTLSVVFSASAGFLLAARHFQITTFLALITGGFLVVGASNAYNQVWERNRDALMHRTRNRPVATGRLSVTEALIVSTVALIGGVALLYSINPLSAGFGFASVVLYTLAYTPLKARSPWSVFVGAFPGAIPFMLGWVAATNHFGIEPGILFLVQFLWQFPHFWAIGWVAYEDYARAGYYLLPNRKPDLAVANLIIIYTMFMIIASVVPAFGFTGALSLSVPAAVVVLGLGAWMLKSAIHLKRSPTTFNARKLMLTSVAYLPLVQIVYVIDRFI